MTEISIVTEEQSNIDEGLFEQIAMGDNDAFARLYYSTYKPVYAFILSMTKNKYDSEDILQETYIKVKGGAHLYQPQGKPLSWIFKIAQNQVRMKIRKEKKERFTSFEELDNIIGIEDVSSVENKMILEKAFSVLKSEERTIIVLHVVSGLKHREIADLLNIPVSTVLSKYNRGLKKLQIKILEKEV